MLFGDEDKNINESALKIDILPGDYKHLQLKAKQQIFCERYINNGFNGSDAAIFAGYSVKNAHVSATALISNPNVKEYIRIRKAEILREIGVDTFRILKELCAIAFCDYRKLYNENGTLKNIAQLDVDSAKALMTVEVFEVWDAEGAKMGETKKVRFNDKIKALELLAKYLGMFEKDNNQSAPTVNVVNVSLDLK